jgi:hypothetical protein
MGRHCKTNGLLHNCRFQREFCDQKGDCTSFFYKKYHVYVSGILESYELGKFECE